MDQDRNPYASPAIAAGPRALRRVPIASVPAEPELGFADIVEQAASPPRKWRLAFTSDEAWLYVPDQDSAFVFTHAEFVEQANVMLWGRFIAVIVNGLLPQGRALAFRLDGDAVTMFRRWVHCARELHVGSALKRRVRLALPLGVFATAFALPILGPNLDPFGLVFGVGLIALAILGPRYPRPILLLVDVVVWWALAVSHGISIANGSKISIPFAIFAFFIGRQSLRAFLFYR
jgi:hypothetical protein